MTKRQFLVTVEDNDESDEMLGSCIRGTIDGQVTVERLADTVGGFPAIWSNYAQPGQVLLFQADRPNPYGHIEVVQDDGTTRRPEPGEILTSEGLQHGFNYPERFIVETSNGDVMGRFRTRDQADTVAERWNQQDTTHEVYPATVRDLREDPHHED
ncbi:endolysin [Arthrobacter phage RosiePosie]|uniref:Endolysin n=1 Tax=Arthrobacter phage RosiePosie TaxID=2015836 RepID=A0A286N3L0_9CAUD|nr:endolysin [Arthrobacter phage RosiePosie]